MPAPGGFEYIVRGEEVVILHRGRPATTLRGRRAADFLEDVEAGDPQELMARLTGNYRRGNERTAKRHPRNAGR
jgi:antitoxin (DNA-binding transcriptional repressor) of toxin-antitoxin stability system